MSCVLVVKSYARIQPKKNSAVALGFKTRSEMANEPTAATTDKSILYAATFVCGGK